MNTTILLVLLISFAALGGVLALTAAVVRGDGRVGPGPGPTPPRSRPDDAFTPYLLDRVLYHR